ncbi:Uncharacterised protein [uncultured archaeon]|nr:Uncharacterised protein [uncultured archaeon]
MQSNVKYLLSHNVMGRWILTKYGTHICIVSELHQVRGKTLGMERYIGVEGVFETFFHKKYKFRIFPREIKKILSEEESLALTMSR